MDIRLSSCIFSLALFSTVTCMNNSIPRSKSYESLSALDKLCKISADRKFGMSDTEYKKHIVSSEEEEAKPDSVLTVVATKNEAPELSPADCNEISQNEEEEATPEVITPRLKSSKHVSIIAKPRPVTKTYRARKAEAYKQRLSMDELLYDLHGANINSYYRSDMEDEDEVKKHEQRPQKRNRYYQSDMEDIIGVIEQDNGASHFSVPTHQDFMKQLSEDPVFSTAIQRLQQHSDDPTYAQPQEHLNESIPSNNQSLSVISGADLLQQLSALSTEDEDERERPRLVLIANISHTMPRLTKIVLSISGGGSRGIIPTIFLRELRSHLFQDSDDYWAPKLPIDLYAGTSVGALVATAENIGKMREVYLNFPQMVRRIFHKNWWNKLLSIFKIFGTYDPNGRLEVIKEMLEGKDGKDLETEELMPLYILNTREDYLYNNKKSDIPLVDALMGTSAAPTFFPPHIVHVSPTENRTILDGGLWKNRPDALAYFHARAQYPNDYIKIIAIGTGKTSKVDNFDDYPATLIGWASRFVDIAMDSSNLDAKIMIHQAKKFDPYLKYYDLNVELDRSDIKTDETDLSFFDRLTNATVLATKNPQSDFNEALEALREKVNSSN